MKKLQTKIYNLKKEIGKISKDSKNPFFKSQYMDLNALLDVVEPLMEKHKLLLTQPLANGEVCTAITDIESGESVTSFLPIPATLTDPQKIGSCITYFRRYTLKSLLAIQETDDDANTASKPTPAPKKETAPAKKRPKGNANLLAAVGEAKNQLNKCLTLKELKECYLGLEKEIQASPEVIAKKDSMKELLENT